MKNVLCDLRIPFFNIIIKNKTKKMRSSRGKTPLRMTPAASDKILTVSKNDASG